MCHCMAREASRRPLAEEVGLPPDSLSEIARERQPEARTTKERPPGSRPLVRLRLERLLFLKCRLQRTIFDFCM